MIPPSSAASSTPPPTSPHTTTCSIVAIHLKGVTNTSTSAEQNKSFLYNQWPGITKSSDGLEPVHRCDAPQRQQILRPNSSFLYGAIKNPTPLSKAPVTAEPYTQAVLHSDTIVSIGSGHKSGIDGTLVLQGNSLTPSIDEEDGDSYIRGKEGWNSGFNRAEGWDSGFNSAEGSDRGFNGDENWDTDSNGWSDGSSISDNDDFDEFIENIDSEDGKDITSELQHTSPIKTSSVLAEPEIPKAQLSLTDTVINTFVAAQKILNQLDISNPAPAFDSIRAMPPKVTNPYCIEIIQAIQRAITDRLEAAESFAKDQADALTLESEIRDRAHATALPYRLDFLYLQMQTLERVAAQLITSKT